MERNGNGAKDFGRNGVVVYMKKRELGEVSKKERSHRLSKLGRELLYYGLTELYGLEGEKEPIGKTPYGKPYLVHHPEIHYNISHSGSVAVCAFAPFPVGVDIQEKVPSAAEKIAGRFFSAEEVQEIQKSEDPERVFFRIWTREESFAKWDGRGLSHNLGSEKKTGYCFEFIPYEGYFGAVWTEKKVPVRFWRIGE